MKRLHKYLPMKRTISIIAIVAAATGFTACEDVIDLDIPEGKTFTVVDAWITNAPGRQDIRITQTAPYTSTQPAPIVDDAIVTLTDLTDGSTYDFTFANGLYSHDPGAGNSIGRINHAYRLRVTLGTEVFEAIDTIRNVPVIDSITYEYKSKEDAASNEEGYYASFHGRDLAGQTDYYWIRSYRNSLDKREADVFAIDGAFNENMADSSAFIVPISEGITEFDKPYQLNETVIVRIASCTKASHTFLTHVESQLENGGLFATILQNVKSNLVNTNAASETRVLGWFGASGLNYKEKVIR